MPDLQMLNATIAVFNEYAAADGLMIEPVTEATADEITAMFATLDLLIETIAR